MSRIKVHRLAVLQDNYTFLIEDTTNKHCVVVDPAEAAPVIKAIEELGLRPMAVWITHDHGDHTAGIAGVRQHFDDDMQVYASARDRGHIPCQTDDLKAGDKVAFADEEAQVFETPGHAEGHISYYLPKSGHLFCGDVLFGVSCGKVFGGKYDDMFNSVEQLRKLPDNVQIWCGHEYTLNNLKFAAHVDPDNAEIQQRLANDKPPTIPLQMGAEKRHNPFMRVHEEKMKQFTGKSAPAEVFKELRDRKDNFKG